VGTRVLIALVACLWTAIPAAAQDAPSTRLRVYPDCQNCFEDYLRDEIRWVDFVRQPQDADVQILSTSRSTGGNGIEVTLRFVGLGRFAGIEHELRALSIAGDSEDVRRRNVLRAVNVGLLAFQAREGLPSTLTIDVESDDEAAARQPGRDPWNFWVFSLGADFMHQAEETSRESNWEFDATADRVTDNWKISFGVGIEEETERFDLDEENPLEVTRRQRRVDWFLGKSINSHWSIGVEGDLVSSTFNNVDLQAVASPAVEFNVFPYEQYATRQLRISYGAGVEHSRYLEETLFGLFRETRPLHAVSVTLDQRQPWGTLQVGMEWNQYLHDTTKTRLEVDGELTFRVLRGLSLEVEGGASRIRDQLSLPRRGAEPEEVLLRLRQLQSGYEVQFSVGFSYSFGSIYNNIVNPRFGGGGGGGGDFD
jgi:hypothetical protein